MYKKLNIFFLVYINLAIFFSCKNSETKSSDDNYETSEDIKGVFKNDDNKYCEMLNGKIECTKNKIKSDLKKIVN